MGSAIFDDWVRRGASTLLKNFPGMAILAKRSIAVLVAASGSPIMK